LKNFDIAPISIYGNVLVDFCYKKFMAGNSVGSVNAVFTFEDSGLGLSYPIALDASLLLIDTDQIEFIDEMIELEEFEVLIRGNDSIDNFTKKILYKLISSLKEFEAEFGAERYSQLCGFLRVTFINRHLKLNN